MILMQTLMLVNELTTQTYELPQVWLAPVSMLIPVLVAAAAHPTAPSSVRQALALVAVLGAAIVEQLTSDGGFTVEGLIVAAVTAFLVQLGAYLGTNRIKDINQAVLPNRGIRAATAAA